MSRPRIDPDHPLTSTERSRRSRQAKQAVRDREAADREAAKEARSVVVAAVTLQEVLERSSDEERVEVLRAVLHGRGSRLAPGLSYKDQADMIRAAVGQDHAFQIGRILAGLWNGKWDDKFRIESPAAD